MQKIAIALLPMSVSLAAACATAIPPARQAAEVERIQCGSGAAEANDLRIVQDAPVIRSEPLYSHVMSGSGGAEERVDGAKLVVVPPAGVSAERMTRILQCHGARALLGKVEPTSSPEDPFWLPNAWVTIEVKPEDGNYAVTLEANDIPTNLELATRARAYAAAHPLSGAPTAQ
jgi:hypothetical protein